MGVSDHVLIARREREKRAADAETSTAADPPEPTETVTEADESLVDIAARWWLPLDRGQ